MGDQDAGDVRVKVPIADELVPALVAGIGPVWVHLEYPTAGDPALVFTRTDGLPTDERSSLERPPRAR